MKSCDGQQPYREERVSFWNGLDNLSGSLCLPAGSGPHAAIVFVAGSGPAGRDGYSSLPPIWAAFAHHGIASLSWDKPGVGESTGNWRSQTNEDRAREATAAIEFLEIHPDIDEDRVGVWGISQAGWVLPSICRTCPNSAFVIAVSIPVGTGAEQELYRVAHCLPADGYSLQDTGQAVAFTRERLKLMEARARYECVVELQRQTENEPWFREVGKLDEENYRFLQANAFLSPRALLSAIRCPLLAIFGERDTIVNVSESVAVLQDVLREAGNSDVTIRVFPGTDHAIFRSKTGGVRELDHSFFGTAIKPYPPEYLETMAHWALERIGNSRSRKNV